LSAYLWLFWGLPQSRFGIPAPKQRPESELARLFSTPSSARFVCRSDPSVFFEVEGSYFWDLAGKLETRDVRLVPLNIQTESGEHLEFGLSAIRDILPYNFEISESVFQPSGPYNYTDYQVKADLSVSPDLGLMNYIQ
jgi:hypothetical protein